MQRKTYWAELQPWGKEKASAKRSEVVLRKFLFNKCNIIRFRVVKWTEGLIFQRKRGGEADPNVVKFAEKIKKSLHKA